MQIHEQNSFKTETPFVMPFEHEQDFTPTYMDMSPTVVKDSSPIPKKRFFRQLLDLPKDIQELRTAQRSLFEDIQETGRGMDRFEERLSESERKFSRFHERMDSLSFSVDPLVGQMSELRNQNREIQKLSQGLKTTKMVIAILLLTNTVLLGLILKPLITAFFN